MISVIIPAYNSGKTIGQCIESLKAQSCKKQYEIIVVDDGSTDGTAGIAAGFGAKVIKQKNSGPATARNAGAKAASGKILLFTDSDCIAEKDWIKEMVKPFVNKRIAGVQGRYKTRQKGIVPTFIQMEIEQRYGIMGKSRHIDFIGSYSAGYRSGMFKKLKGFDESFPKASGEDPELSFRMGKAGQKMVFNPDAVVYHTHPESLKKYLKSRYGRGYWGRLLYKLHPDRKRAGSYKSGTFFYGVGLTCLLSLLSFMFVFISLFLSAISFLLLAGTLLFESEYFMVKDKRFIVIAPFLVFFRNISIGLGILAGLARIR